jgi:hypothetical protein
LCLHDLESTKQSNFRSYLMPICWSWAFGPETKTEREDDLGWTATGGFAFPRNSVDDPAKVWSYTGSPLRWSVENTQSQTNDVWLWPPLEAFEGWNLTQQGAVSAPIKLGRTSYGNSGIFVLAVRDAQNRIAGVRPTTTNGNTLSLYLGTSSGVFQASTAALTTTIWQYITLKFDFTSTTQLRGAVSINGVEQIPTQTRSQSIAASTDIYFRVEGNQGSSDGMAVGQLIFWDDFADNSDPKYFVTRINPEGNGTNTGTWTRVGAIATGVDGATDAGDDTIFTSAGSLFTRTIASSGSVSGVELVLAGGGSAAITDVVSDTQLTVVTGLGTGLSGQVFAVSSSSDYASVRAPLGDGLQKTAYLEEASPTTGDLAEFLTSGSSGIDGSISSQLGIVPDSVVAVSLHTYSVGTLVTASVDIREGPGTGTTTVALGSNKVVDPTTTSYLTTTAISRSLGASWTGSSFPVFVYNVK